MKNNLIKLGIVISPFLFVLLNTAQVKAESYGWSPDVDNSWKGPPSCTNQKPKAPILYQPNHPSLLKAKGKGQIRLQWTKVPGADNYSVFYGLSSKNYIYSAPNVGNSDNYTVSGLANRKYYFTVVAMNGCAGSSKSNEWVGRPGAGAIGGVFGAKVKPVIKAPAAKNNTVPAVSTPVPTKESTVKGVESSAPANTGGTNYQPPYNPPQAPLVAVKVTPKPQNIFQKIWSLLFGK